MRYNLINHWCTLSKNEMLILGVQNKTIKYHK